MRKELLKRSVAIAAAISMIFSNTASAGVWQQKAGNWFVKDEKSGKNLTGWYQDEKKDWYYLEPSTEGEFNGALRAGWLPAGKDWYFLNPIHDGSFGRMFENTWLWVDGYCYYFDASGKMLAGTKTPDGYTVNGNGQWTVNGVVQYVPGKGIITKKANSNSGSSGSGSSSGSHSGNHGGSGSNGANNGGTNSGGNTGSDTENQQVTLTVKYMDADTKEILDTRVLTGKTGETVDIEAVEIGGYSVCDGQPASFTFSENDAEIYVLYRKTLLVGGIEIRYVNKENNEIIAVNSVSGKIGETYIVHIPAIDGYKAVTKDEKILTFSNSEQLVTVEYRTIKDGEEKDQSMVPNDRLKVAKADNAEEKEVLHQMYTGIFDYRQNTDGTIELAVYNDNPILKYLEEGRYEINDIVYIEPTEDFTSGITFVYQSHDDEYTGEMDGYDAETCEVIHAWQVAPSMFFAPGTNIDMTLPVVTEDQVADRMEWKLTELEEADEEENTQSTLISRFRKVMRVGRKKSEPISLIKSNTDKTKIDIKKFLLENKFVSDDIKEYVKKHTTEFSLQPMVDATVGDVVLKIYIPFLEENGDILTNRKIYQFSFVPAVDWKLKTKLSLNLLADSDAKVINDAMSSTTNKVLNKIPVSDDKTGYILSEKEAKNKRANALKFHGLWIEGIDLKDKGIYPLFGQGISILSRIPTTNVHDMIRQDATEVESFKNLNIYVGVVECLIFKASGKASFEATAEGGLGHTTMGIKIAPNRLGQWVAEDFEEEGIKVDLLKKISIDGKIGLDDTKLGAYFMFSGSVAGMTPIGVGPEVGISLQNTHGEIKGSATFENGQADLKLEKAELKGSISAYATGAFHARVALEKAKSEGADPDKKGLTIEFFPIDKEFKKAEFKLYQSIEGETVTDTTSIRAYDEKDEFRICDQTGKDLKKTVHPIQTASGKYTFDCPGYILKQDEKGQDKAYKVTELHINLPSDANVNEWESLKIPGSVKSLTVDQILTKACTIDLSKASELEEIFALNSENEIGGIDLTNNTQIKKVYIASKQLADLKLPSTNFLEELYVDGKNGGKFDKLNLPDNCSTLRKLVLKGTSIDEIDTTGMIGLESLNVESSSMLKIDTSNMAALKELNIQETGVTSLDVSANKKLSDLFTSKTLEKFVGNGKVMPNMTTLKWYKNPDKKTRINKDYICREGEAIYSELYNGEEITRTGSLIIDKDQVFRPADQYGNELKDWPGYDPEKNGASPYQVENKKWNVQLPQYVITKDSLGNEYAYKVIDVTLKRLNWNLIDGSKAPEIEKISNGNGVVEDYIQELILPAGLRELSINHCYQVDYGNNHQADFLCDFSRAPKLEKIHMTQGRLADYHFDFSANKELKEFEWGNSRSDEAKIDIDLPKTNTLESIDIFQNGGYRKWKGKPLDLSGLTGLKKLTLFGPDQENIDLEDSMDLEELELDSLTINSLDLSHNLKLKRLYVDDTPNLKHLDVSGLTELKENGLTTSAAAICTFTGNGFTMPHGLWYQDPAKTIEVSECKKGQTIYSFYYEAETDSAKKVMRRAPVIPETASNALRKTDAVLETEE